MHTNIAAKASQAPCCAGSAVRRLIAGRQHVIGARGSHIVLLAARPCL